MTGVHHMLVHFPLALWALALVMILLRTLTTGELARLSERALVPVLALSLLGALAAVISGFLVWPWEAALSSPLTRNHILMALWSTSLWAVITALIWLIGSALWDGIGRWVMLVLGLIASCLFAITGTLGGHLAGVTSFFSIILDSLGWTVYETFYLPSMSLVLLFLIGGIMVVLGVTGRKT
ncbi:MAG TPA: heme ABC transporter permease [Deltaproteobacteria bacterium]|nr:heme ABC transporter permease [Deltaproteobacteria bacterium]